jgi:thymidine kinase
MGGERGGPRVAGRGRLEVIVGCMFSGKSTELIRRLRGAAAQGQVVVAVKPRRDTRYGAADLATHAGERFPATAVEDAGAMAGVLAAAGRAAVVGIDEGHFFGVELAGAALRLREEGRRVLVAGVDLDHRGAPFEPFASLRSVADEVLRLTAPCAVCGGPAVHSQRLVASADRIVVGGAEAYEPRCERCFEPARP